MFKVSFKKDKKFPIKKVQRNEHTRETIVTLKGEVILPEFLQYYIPPKIWDWIETCKNVQAGFSMTKMHLTIKGKATRSKSDADDPILGERIAEARAKINLYYFMLNFCKRLYKYYLSIMYESYIPEVSVDDSIYCTNDSILASIYKYRTLWNLEFQHLQKLLANESDTENPSKP